MHSGHVGLSCRIKWVSVLSSCVCPDRRWARRTAFARLEVAIQSVSAGASDEGFRGGKWDRSWRRVDGNGNCFREFINSHVPCYALMAWYPNGDDGAFPVFQSPANRPGVMCATVSSFRYR